MADSAYYQLHRLTYKHCISLSRLLVLLVDSFNNPEFYKKYNIRKGNRTKLYKDSDDQSGFFYINNKTHQYSRIGNLGTIDTHCLSYDVHSTFIHFDGAYNKRVYFDELDYSEEFFFQQSLIHEGNALIYMIVFPYLKKHCKYNFEIDINFDVLTFCSIAPEIKNTMLEEDLWDSVKDLYSMSLEKCDNLSYEKEMFNRVE